MGQPLLGDVLKFIVARHLGQVGHHDDLDAPVGGLAVARVVGRDGLELGVGCCADSVGGHAPFDQGLGDIFAPRVAGNYVDTDMLGNMEFGAAVAGSLECAESGHAGFGEERQENSSTTSCPYSTLVHFLSAFLSDL